MRLLDTEGITLISRPSAQTVLTLNVDFPESGPLHEITADTIEIRFLSSSDGRAFSIVRYLRDRCSFKGKIYAIGRINPDQVTLALQCGYCGVLIADEDWNRYGEATWENAIVPTVNAGYRESLSASVTSIWSLRKST